MDANSQVEVLGSGVMPTVEANALFNPLMFEKVWSMAEKFVGTTERPNTMLPKTYQANPGAFLIALNVANDPKNPMNVLSVMQVLDIIQGKPSWASTHVIAMLNSSQKFPGGISFHFEEKGEIEVEFTEWVKNENDPNGKNKPISKKAKIVNRSCYVTATKKNGDVVTGTKVDLAMAVKEGWYFKNGSKWQTMEEQMLKYRSATFFSRTEAPEVLRGFSTVDEMEDITIAEIATPVLPQPAKTVKSFEQLQAELKPLGVELKYLGEGYTQAIGNKVTSSLKTLQNLGFVCTEGQYKIKTTEPLVANTSTSSKVEVNESTAPISTQQTSLFGETPVIETINQLELYLEVLGLKMSPVTENNKGKKLVEIVGGNTEGLEGKLAAIGFVKAKNHLVRYVDDLTEGF